MRVRFLFIFFLAIFFGSKHLKAQCLANAGSDLSICDGDGSNSNWTYLDGSASMVPQGDVNYEWTVLNGDGNDWETTLVITNSESDEMDPRFKYPRELVEDKEFLVPLEIFTLTA